MTLLVSFFPKNSSAQSHRVNILLGQKNLSYHAGLWKQLLPAHPFPLQPSQAHEVVVVVGGSKHQKAAAAARQGSLSCITKQGQQRAAFIASLPLLKLFQEKREQHT